MSKRSLFVLVISTCILGLSFHFIVEGLGGIHDHFIGYQAPGMIDTHDGDLFVLSEFGPGMSIPVVSNIFVPLTPGRVSRPLPPLFHPPKSF